MSNNTTVSTSGTGTGTGILVSGGTASANITGNLELRFHGNAIGIDVSGGTATITGNHIYDNTTGIRFINGGTGSVSGNDFSGSPANGTDLFIDATAGTVTIGDGNSFAGSAYYINNASSQAFDLSGYTTTTFEGFNAATTTVTTGNLSTFFAIEDEISDYLDNPSFGYVKIKSGHVFLAQSSEAVTPGAIQRGVTRGHCQ